MILKEPFLGTNSIFKAQFKSMVHRGSRNAIFMRNDPLKQNAQFPLCTTSEISNEVAEHLYVPFMEKSSFALSNEIVNQGHRSFTFLERGNVWIQHVELVQRKVCACPF